MKVSMRRFLWIAIVSLMFVFAVPAASQAQGRGPWRGRGPDFSKKCGKFVNCHDARDGRWDGRGPRQDCLRLRFFVRQGRGHRRFSNYDYSRYGRPRRFNRVRSFNGEDRFARRRGWTRFDDSVNNFFRSSLTRTLY